VTERILHYPVAQTCGFSLLSHFGGRSCFFQLDLIASMPSYIFHPPTNSIRERKRLKYEGSAYLQKTCHNYTKAKKIHARCQQHWKAIGRCV